MLGGLGLKLAQMKNMKPTKKCVRCGLRYEEDKEKCSHCGDLDDFGLQQLKARIAEQHQSNVNLGRLFIYVAIIIIILMFVVVV